MVEMPRVAKAAAPLPRAQAFIAVCLGLAPLTPCVAQTVVPTYNAVGAETMMEVIKSLGSADIKPDGSDPQGPILTVSQGGINYQVFMDDCDGGQPSLCKSLEYRATLPPGAINFSQLNSFNESMRYATAYFTDKGVPKLRMDVSVRGGVTSDFLAYSTRIFLKVVAGFAQQANK